jgi:hypothetical protein
MFDEDCRQPIREKDEVLTAGILRPQYSKYTLLRDKSMPIKVYRHEITFSCGVEGNIIRLGSCSRGVLVKLGDVTIFGRKELERSEKNCLAI